MLHGTDCLGNLFSLTREIKRKVYILPYLNLLGSLESEGSKMENIVFCDFVLVVCELGF